MGVWFSAWCIITRSFRRVQKDRRQSLELTEIQWRWRTDEKAIQRGRHGKGREGVGGLWGSVWPVITSNATLDLIKPSVKKYPSVPLNLSYLSPSYSPFGAVCVCGRPCAFLTEIPLLADWSHGYTVSKRDCSKLEKREHFHWWGQGYLTLRTKPPDASAVPIASLEFLPHGHTRTHSLLSDSHSSLSNLSSHFFFFFPPSPVCLLCSTSLGSSSAFISQAAAPQLLLIWSE